MRLSIEATIEAGYSPLRLPERPKARCFAALYWKGDIIHVFSTNAISKSVEAHGKRFALGLGLERRNFPPEVVVCSVCADL